MMCLGAAGSVSSVSLSASARATLRTGPRDGPSATPHAVCSSGQGGAYCRPVAKPAANARAGREAHCRPRAAAAGGGAGTKARDPATAASAEQPTAAWTAASVASASMDVRVLSLESLTPTRSSWISSLILLPFTGPPPNPSSSCHFVPRRPAVSCAPQAVEVAGSREGG